MFRTDVNGKEYLILAGGEDVSPQFYGEDRHEFTHTNHKRDIMEIGQIFIAKKEGIPIIGVCRGAQLLCVVNGGKLWQHAEGHNTSHAIEVTVGNEKTRFDTVAAGHHQIMRPEGEYEIIGVDARKRKTTVYDPYNNKFSIQAPEIVLWEKEKCLGIQPHPEWMKENNSFNVWLRDYIRELFGIEFNTALIY